MGKFKQLFLESEIGSIKTDFRSFLSRNGRRSPRADYKYKGLLFSIDRGVDDDAFYVRVYDVGPTDDIRGKTPTAEADIRSSESGYITKQSEIDPVEGYIGTEYRRGGKTVMSNGFHSVEQTISTLIKIAKN